MPYHVVAKTDEINEGEAISVEIEGHPIAIFRTQENFFAIQNECTHVGGPLCEGYLNETVVTCPWHGAKFDITSGKALTKPPAREDLKTYNIKVTNEEILVEVPNDGPQKNHKVSYEGNL